MALTIGTILVSVMAPASLVRTVLSYGRQLRPGDELIAVVLPWEDEVHAALASIEAPVSVVDVYLPGLIHRMNAGVGACSADIVVFAASNPIAPADWLERIRLHFREKPKLGAVMGPVATNGEVEIQPGYGLALRRKLIDRFDTRAFRAYGEFEEHVALAVRGRGYEVLCDPSLAATFSAEGRPDDSRPAPLFSGASRLFREFFRAHAGQCPAHPRARCSVQRRRYCGAGAGVPLLDCVLDPRLTAI